MLRYLTIFNPDVSINQGKLVTDMSNIGGGAPSTRCKGKLMKYTETIHPTIMMNGLNKKIVI